MVPGAFPIPWSSDFTNYTQHITNQPALLTNKRPSMDSSTLTFVAILAVAFVFLRWFINADEPDLNSPLDVHDVATGDAPERVDAEHIEQQRRPVTTDMIEVVQSIAPHLTVAQIRHDLRRSGSVQETVERVLSEGTLPVPPGGPADVRDGATGGNHAADERNSVDNIHPENLLEKYKVEEGASGSVSTPQWSQSPEVRAQTLQEKRSEMILKARKRLEAQLSNEQDLSALK